jgi:anti-sigma-K factor RskA
VSGRRKFDALDLVLGELSPDEQAEAARRLRGDARLRRSVEQLAPVVARLERQPRETWDPPEPPPLVVGAPLPVRPPRRRPVAFVLRPSVALALSVSFVAAGLGLASLLDRAERREAPAQLAAAERHALTALPGEFGRAELVTARDGRVTLEATGLAPDRRGHHELWLLPAEGGGDPVPVGRFRVAADGRATATYRLPADPGRYALYDVSEEPDDGNPAHSGRSILRAPT